jgi:Phosphotransferase enzyme family
VTRSPSILELLHPDRTCRGTLLIGSGCPVTLRPRNKSEDDELDLVVIAPSAEEAQTEGWLDREVARGAAQLAPDGLICALVPAAHRLRLGRLLADFRLEMESVFLYLGSVTCEEDLVPLQRKAIQQVAQTLPGKYRLGARLLARLSGLPGITRFLRRWHPGALIVGRRPNARPLFEWFLQSTLDARCGSTAALHAKWRRNQASVLLRAYDPAGQLTKIAKLTLNEPDAGCRISHEADFLQQAGHDLRDVGISVPEVRLLAGHGVVPVLLENVVPGESAAHLLLARRRSTPELLTLLGETLLTWSRKTTVNRIIDTGWLEREVLQPAAEVMPEIEAGQQYLAWLRTRCNALTNLRLPLVTVHGDLTMWNVLITPESSLGFVDWEAAAVEGLPLSDLCYSALDLFSAARRYRDRVEAFVRCFESIKAETRQVTDLRTRLARAIGLSRSGALLCFHACWLQHAARELPKRTAGEARPFCQIVNRIARQPESYETAGLTE